MRWLYLFRPEERLLGGLCGGRAVAGGDRGADHPSLAACWGTAPASLRSSRRPSSARRFGSFHRARAEPRRRPRRRARWRRRSVAGRQPAISTFTRCPRRPLACWRAPSMASVGPSLRHARRRSTRAANSSGWTHRRRRKSIPHAGSGLGPRPVPLWCAAGVARRSAEPGAVISFTGAGPTVSPRPPILPCTYGHRAGRGQLSMSARR